MKSVKLHFIESGTAKSDHSVAYWNTNLAAEKENVPDLPAMSSASLAEAVVLLLLLLWSNNDEAPASEPALDNLPSPPPLLELSELADGLAHMELWPPPTFRLSPMPPPAAAAAASRLSRSLRSAAALLSTYCAANWCLGSILMCSMWDSSPAPVKVQGWVRKWLNN